jgi:hypothetical protein
MNGPRPALHLEKLGVKLTALSAAQANYLNLPRSGPFNPSIAGIDDHQSDLPTDHSGTARSASALRSG